MSNKVIAIVVGVVVVLGGAYYAMRGASESVKDTNSIAVGEPKPSSPTENTSGKKMSFGAFLKQGGSYVCTFSQYVEEVESKGTMYVDGENARGTFVTSVSGVNVNSEFLSTGGFTYSWSSQTPGKGFKSAIKKNIVEDKGINTSSPYTWDSNLVGDYNCDTWSVDRSKFIVPSNVSFTEFKQ